MAIINLVLWVFSVLFAKQLYVQHGLGAKKKSAGKHPVPELFFPLLPHEAGIEVSRRDSVCGSCSSCRASAASSEGALNSLVSRDFSPVLCSPHRCVVR